MSIPGQFAPSTMTPRSGPAAADSFQDPGSRLVSIDAYRGVVMFLMLAEVLDLSGMARAMPESVFWGVLGWHQSHAPWTGCTVHDLIQPSFAFLVGVALPFSIANRRRRGQSAAAMTRHTFGRALVLILLGVFLRSVGRDQTHWTFEDTLTQIGLGYPLLYWCGLGSVARQWTCFAILLVGYWLAWAVYPLPGPGFDPASVAVPPDWTHHAAGFAAHWNLNANLGGAFDRWFLNLFPRAQPFVGHPEGYLTLNFIPATGTMLLGLLAGGWLRSGRADDRRRQRMLIAGLGGVALGLALQAAGICPIVKKIWTPAWTLFSGGICFLLLAFFHVLLDRPGRHRWAFPFIVVGANSIAAYGMAHLMEDFVVESLSIHLGADSWTFLGAVYAPVVRGTLVLAVFWLSLLYLYRQRLFIRI